MFVNSKLKCNGLKGVEERFKSVIVKLPKSEDPRVSTTRGAPQISSGLLLGPTPDGMGRGGSHYLQGSGRTDGDKALEIRPAPKSAGQNGPSTCSELDVSQVQKAQPLMP